MKCSARKIVAVPFVFVVHVVFREIQAMRASLRSTVPAVRLVLLLALIASGACASAGGGSTAGSGMDVLTEQDMTDYRYLTAFEAIRQLRPIWLRTRGGDNDVFGAAAAARPTRSGEPRDVSDLGRSLGISVYLNGVEAREGLIELERISVLEIREMRRLNASEASSRFGIGHSSGAILVTLLR